MPWKRYWISLGYGDIVDKALSLGAKQFITKPVDFEEVAPAMRAVIPEAARPGEGI
jgi:DNA-binding response OmpR family regulator